MAGEFLRKKWDIYYNRLDVNNDGLITVEDANIFSERFIEHHKMKGEKTQQLKMNFQAIWNALLQFGQEEIDKRTFLEKMEKEYTENRTEFIERISRAQRDLVDLFDVNNDGLLSDEEYVIACKCSTIEGLDRKYVHAYPQIKPGFISKKVFSDSWVAFLVNDDENNIDIEKPIMLGFGMIDHV